MMVESAGAAPDPILAANTDQLIGGERPVSLPDGVIFLCRQDVLDRSIGRQTGGGAALARHTVVVDVVRGYELALCERLGLAAAVGGDHYAHWQPVDFVDNHDVDPPTPDVGEQALQRWLRM